MLSLLLAAALVVGCVPPPAGALGMLEALFSGREEAQTVTPFSQMEYTRPDLQAMEDLLDEACTLAKGKKAGAILDAVYAFYDAYDRFYTDSALANIHYSADLTDEAWEAEDSFCTASSGQVDQMLDSLYAALAASPCRDVLERRFFGEGFFSSYDTQGDWEPDETLLDLSDREASLISQYYAQSNQQDSLFNFFGLFSSAADDMAETLASLVRVRRALAAHLGYDSYEDYANEALYGRDYTPAQTRQYLAEIQEKLVPLYREYGDDSYDLRDCTQEQIFDYVEQTASAIGGQVLESFRMMKEGELYDITVSDKKYPSSFELYLTSYQEPFVFLNPSGIGSDKLTFAHEFGHFCNDNAMGGAYASIDTAEVFSQAMEYLSLCYGPADEPLIQAKLSDSLCTYVEQACFASFEQAMYQLPEERLTADGLKQLFEETARAYGLADYAYFENTDFTSVTHFYTNPMYVSSYIFSNDAAMQIYQMERSETGSGLKCFLDNLDNPEVYFLAFLESAGLESPFRPGRLDEVAQTFQNVLTHGETGGAEAKSGLLDLLERFAA